MVDMSQEKKMNRFIPFSCELHQVSAKVFPEVGHLIPSGTVPPSIVKSPIGKSCNFRKDIQHALKNNIERQ